MTVGLIGYGHIGTRVVRLLKPFGCRIQAVSGGRIGKAGIKVRGTDAPGSTFTGSSVPPKGRMSVSSNPRSTSCRRTAAAASSGRPCESRVDATAWIRRVRHGEKNVHARPKVRG